MQQLIHLAWLIFALHNNAVSHAHFLTNKIKHSTVVEGPGPGFECLINDRINRKILYSH